jgi:hypothetical protein
MTARARVLALRVCQELLTPLVGCMRSFSTID